MLSAVASTINSDASTIQRVPPSAHKENDSRPRVYTSAELLQGHREAWIEHGQQMYRLRLTSAGKLYLTK